MVSIATATLKCNLNKRGCDKVEQIAESEHVRYSCHRATVHTQTNVRLRSHSKFGQENPKERTGRQPCFLRNSISA